MFFSLSRWINSTKSLPRRIDFKTFYQNGKAQSLPVSSQCLEAGFPHNPTKTHKRCPVGSRTIRARVVHRAIKLLTLMTLKKIKATQNVFLPILSLSMTSGKRIGTRMSSDLCLQMFRSMIWMTVTNPPKKSSQTQLRESRFRQIHTL
jgi:hypothetical protein